MRCGKGKDEVIAHILHAFGHHIHQIAVILNHADRASISPTGKQEEEKERADQALIQRAQFGVDRAILHPFAGGLINQRGAGREHHDEPECHNEKDRKTSMPQTFGYQRTVSGSDFGIIIARSRLRAARPCAQTRLDNLICHIPNDWQIDECHRRNEPPVSSDIRAPAWIKRACCNRFLSYAKQQCVQLTG